MSVIAQLVATHNAMLASVGNAVQNHNQHFIEAVTVLEAMDPKVDSDTNMERIQDT